MALVIMRVLDDPRTNLVTLFDEVVKFRGDVEDCAYYMNKLQERAEKAGISSESGQYREGWLYDRYTLRNGVKKEYLLVDSRYLLTAVNA
jgi:ribosome-binding factor A